RPPGPGVAGPGGTLRAAFQARSQQRRAGSRRADRPDQPGDELSQAMAATITTLAPIVGTAAAVKALGWPRSSWYRLTRRTPAPLRSPRPPPAPRQQPRARHPGRRPDAEL